VTQGVPAAFAITDELYLAEVFTDDVSPLLASQAAFTRDHFWSADAAVRGRMNCREGWNHPPGSPLIGWTKRVLNSTLVYLQPGDGATAFENPHYRRLLENSVRWVAAAAPRRGRR
jgi:type 1 glutamine amidotransferase